MQAQQAVGEAEDGIVVAVTDGHALQQVFEGHAGFAFQRARFGLEGFFHAHGVDEHKAVLGPGGAVADALQAFAVQGTHAPAFHLFVIAATAHVAHEEQHFQRLDVGAGGDHVHGDGDTRVKVVAKTGQNAVGVFFAAVGHLFAEGVALAVDFADDLDDVVGMAVGFGEDEGFWGLCAVGEDGCFHSRFHGHNHLADLAGVDHGAVQFFAVVGGVVFGFGPALFAGSAVAVVHPFFRVQLRAPGGDFGVDLIHVIADVDAIGDGLLVGVFGDDVLVEKAEGALIGGGREADERGVEVIQHLLPEVVNAAMTFVDDNEIESLDGNGGIVAYRLFLGGALLQFVEGDIFGGVVDGLAAENGIHALNGGDADLRVGVDGAGAEALDVVKLGEFAPVIGGRVGHKLLMRLLAEVAGVHQKEDALGATELEQTIGGGNGGEGFARAGGHVDEGAWLAAGQGSLQSGDGADLAVAQVVGGQWGQCFGEAAAQGAGLPPDLGEVFGAEEMEDFP